MKKTLSADSASILMTALAVDVRSETGFSYDGTELVIPAAYAARAKAIMDVSGWDVVSPTTALDAARIALLSAIDEEAERQRLRWITPGAGQAMTYARKVEEARRVDADPAADPATCPMLAASIGIDGDDLASVAAKILAMDAAWGQIGGAIEARRLGLKRDVGLAADATALSLIDLTAGWPE